MGEQMSLFYTDNIESRSYIGCYNNHKLFEKNDLQLFTIDIAAVTVAAEVDHH